MKKILYAAVLILFLFSQNSYSQNRDTLTVAFYNLENLFDTADDPSKEDGEFTPAGDKQWSDERLEHKFINTAKVIRSMNNFNGPDILGVCEVENQSLLDNLTTKYLKDHFYKVAYMESPDNRGIDNGLIYNADKFILRSVIADTVILSDGWPTRQIVNINLYHRKTGEVFHFFVNHWPSRRGGEEESEKNRIAAAETLKKRINLFLSEDQDAKIFIMGDFNDEPGNKSIETILGAAPLNCSANNGGNPSQLYNTAYTKFSKGEGSYKYQDDWNMLDQIIVSEPIVSGSEVSYICDSFEIFKPDFILTKSGKYAGTSIPTYGGSRYLGGYSDHFPVLAKFLIK